jgi:hypothetical protein
MTCGKSITGLTMLALEALRKQPNCAEIRSVSLYGLPDVRDGRNWEISYVDSSRTWIGDIKPGVIAVHYQLGRLYQWIAED